jgi:hypothetical protein
VAVQVLDPPSMTLGGVHLTAPWPLTTVAVTLKWSGGSSAKRTVEL